MNCSGFSFDVYALHVLGLAEDPERSDLIWHVKKSCTRCLRSLTDALEFWFLFASLAGSESEFDDIDPGEDLKTRILNSIRPANLRKRYIPAWTRERIAAGIMVLAGTGATTWQLGRFSLHSRLMDSEREAGEQKSAADQLARENNALRSKSPAPPAPAIVPQPVSSPSSSAIEAALQRQVDDASAAASAAEQALATERSRIAQLQREIVERSAQLNTAVQGRDEALNQLRAAERAMEQSRQQASQREIELADYQARVRELETQIVQYRLTIDRQQQNLAQHLQIAALLHSPSVKVVQLRATEADPKASGVALIGSDSTLAFYASNLPPLPMQRVYQLWLLRSRGPAIASGGIFNNAAGDLPAVQMRNSQLLASLTGLAVTDEPAGGSPLPTGHKLLVGTPR